MASETYLAKIEKFNASGTFRLQPNLITSPEVIYGVQLEIQAKKFFDFVGRSSRDLRTQNLKAPSGRKNFFFITPFFWFLRPARLFQSPLELFQPLRNLLGPKEKKLIFSRTELPGAPRPSHAELEGSERMKKNFFYYSILLVSATCSALSMPFRAVPTPQKFTRTKRKKIFF